MKMTILILTLVAVTSLVTFYFTSDIYFKKGVVSGKEMCKEDLRELLDWGIQSGPVIGHNSASKKETGDNNVIIDSEPLERVFIPIGSEARENKNTIISSRASGKQEWKGVAGPGINAVVAAKFTMDEVKGKWVRYSNGDEYKILGGEPNGLLHQDRNGNTWGFGSLNDIVEIIE